MQPVRDDYRPRDPGRTLSTFLCALDLVSYVSKLASVNMSPELTDFATVAGYSAMGLRLGDDETHKIPPPKPIDHSQDPPKTRSKNSIRRKDRSGNSRGHNAKPSDSGYKGFMFHVRLGANHGSIQSAPRDSVLGRPASQASFTPSVASKDDEHHHRKWWPGRGHKVKQSTSDESSMPSISTSRSPSTEFFRTAQEPIHRRQHHRGMSMLLWKAVLVDLTRYRGASNRHFRAVQLPAPHAY